MLLTLPQAGAVFPGYEWQEPTWVRRSLGTGGSFGLRNWSGYFSKVTNFRGVYDPFAYSAQLPTILLPETPEVEQGVVVQNISTPYWSQSRLMEQEEVKDSEEVQAMLYLARLELVALRNPEQLDTKASRQDLASLAVAMHAYTRRWEEDLRWHTPMLSDLSADDEQYALFVEAASRDVLYMEKESTGFLKANTEGYVTRAQMLQSIVHATPMKGLLLEQKGEEEWFDRYIDLASQWGIFPANCRACTNSPREHIHLGELYTVAAKVLTHLP